MNISSPAVLGALRMLGGLVLFAVLNVVLTFLSNSVNISAIVGTGAASIISIAAAAWEHQIQASGNGALFGLVKNPNQSTSNPNPSA